MPRFDSLKTPSDVQFRSSLPHQLAPQPAKIVIDDDFKNIEVKFINSSQTFPVDEIENTKWKDFTDPSNNSTIYILSISLKDGQHISLQFANRDVRDTWDHSLRYLITNTDTRNPASDTVRVPQDQYRTIKRLELQTPLAGEMARIDIDLGGKQCTFVVKDDQGSSRACTALAVEFVEAHSILPTETTSLYRYVRAVVQRAIMEKEVGNILEEINSYYFDAMQEAKGLHSSDADPDQILRVAEERLKSLSADLPLRIGQHGSGAIVVTQVLKRNIDKVRLMNELSARLAKATSGPSDRASLEPGLAR